MMTIFLPCIWAIATQQSIILSFQEVEMTWFLKEMNKKGDEKDFIYT